MRGSLPFYLYMMLSVFVSTLASCNQGSALDNKLDDAEKVMNEFPDSALKILRGIEKGCLNSKAEQARFALLMSQALDKNYIDTTSFEILQPALDYFLKNVSPDEKLRTYYYQGRIFQNQENKDSAMQSFMRGREYCSNASDTLTMANLLVAQGTIFSITYKFEDFIKVNLEAAKLYSELGRTDYEILSLANALDGCILIGNKNRADSIISIAHTRISKNPEYASAVSPYLLSYAINFGDREDITDMLDYYNSTDTVDDMTKIDVAQAYYKIGDILNAKRLLNSIDSTSGVKKSLKYLAVISEILEHSGDYEGALNAYRDFNTLIDSIHQSIFAHDLLFAKERHEMEKSSMLKLQKRDKAVWLSLCFAFVLLIMRDIYLTVTG